MTLRLQIILLLFLAAGMAIVVNMVRKRVLELKYVLTWMFADIMLAILVLFPRVIGSISKLLGIYSPMNMIFFLGFVLSLFILFSLTVAISRASANERRMSQTIAILRREIQELQKQQEMRPQPSEQQDLQQISEPQPPEQPDLQQIFEPQPRDRQDQREEQPERAPSDGSASGKAFSDKR